jgi:hypothetical protein
MLGTIAELLLYYPNANISPDYADALADMWFEDMGSMDPVRFKKAVQITRKGSRFFPVPAQIIENYNLLTARIPPFRQIEHTAAPISLAEMRKIRAENLGRKVSVILDNVPKSRPKIHKTDPARAETLRTQAQQIQEGNNVKTHN